jgi:hypothetical protein
LGFFPSPHNKIHYHTDIKASDIETNKKNYSGWGKGKDRRGEENGERKDSISTKKIHRKKTTEGSCKSDRIV